MKLIQLHLKYKIKTIKTIKVSTVQVTVYNDLNFYLSKTTIICLVENLKLISN